MRVARTMKNHAAQQSTVTNTARATATTSGTAPTRHPLTAPCTKKSTTAVLLEHTKLLVQKCKYRCLSASAVCVILLIVVLWNSFRTSHGHKEDAFSYCNTTACDTYAAMLLNAIDSKRDPCDNFYRHVCDEWRNEKSVYEAHVRNFAGDLSKTLKANVSSLGQTATEKAAGFFQSCVKVVTSEEGELDNFRQVLRTCGIEWPRVSNNPDVLRSLIRLQKRLSNQNLLNIRLQSYRGQQSVYIFSGRRIALFYSNTKVIRSFSKYREYYEKFQGLFRTANMTFGELLKYEPFVKIEGKIFSQLLQHSKEDYKWRAINVSELARLTPEISYKRWSQVLASELNVSTNTHIKLVEDDYVRAFSLLLRKVGEIYLHHQVGWIVVQSLAPFVNRRTIQAYGGDASDPVEVNLWKCLGLTEMYMGWTTYAEYISNNVDKNMTKDIADIMDNIATSTTAKVSVPKSIVDAGSDLHTQMHDMLRYHNAYNSQRLDAIFSNISDMGPSLVTNWYNFIRDRDSNTNQSLYLNQRIQFSFQIWDTFSFTFYNTYYKEYVIPPNALMLPLYDPSVSTATKYGGFGSLLGTAAIGISQYPSPGIAKTTCFNESFSNGQFDRTLLHTTAALQIAWDAYQNASRAEGDVRLRGLSTLTANQIFFIASCYILCGQSPDLEPDRRCNEPLKHHADFPKAFSCPEGSSMNPRKKCQLF